MRKPAAWRRFAAAVHRFFRPVPGSTASLADGPGVVTPIAGG